MSITRSIDDKNEETVVSYKYQTTFTSMGEIGIMSRDEYFIPSQSICFNRQEAFISDEPKNMDNYLTHSTTFLQKTLLQKELVIQIADKLCDHYRTNLDALMNKEILFVNQLPSVFFPRETDFEKNYNLYGTMILPEYILRYIENVDLNKNTVTVNRIFDVIKSLDDTEKKSLENCLTGRIMEREERFKKYNIKESSMSISDGLLSIGAGVGLACLTESIPVGIFTGAITLFGKSMYAKSKKDQCEIFQKQIFEALNTKQEQKIYTFS